MRKTIILAFFVCIFCSTLCFGGEARQKSNFQSRFTVSKSVENDFPNIFRPIGDLFRRIFGRKREPIICLVANVENVTLSQTEIISSCSMSNTCSESNQKIEVSTYATDPENDPLDYSYTVSDGKIIGLNKAEEITVSKILPKTYDIKNVKKLEDSVKVVWDLSGVKAGTYTITAAVDDGCGFCGTPVTKTVTIKDCFDCKDE